MDKAQELVKPENLETAQTYINFVKENLEPLAHQINVSVEWLWHILVQQARVEAIIYLLISLSLSVTAFVFARMFFKNIKLAHWGDSYSKRTVYKHNKTGVEIKSLLDDWEHRLDYIEVKIDSITNSEAVLTLIGGIVGLLMLTVSIFTATSGITTIVTGLVNPEYRAIEKIVDFANGNNQSMNEEES